MDMDGWLKINRWMKITDKCKRFMARDMFLSIQFVVILTPIRRKVFYGLLA